MFHFTSELQELQSELEHFGGFDCAASPTVYRCRPSPFSSDVLQLVSIALIAIGDVINILMTRRIGVYSSVSYNGATYLIVAMWVPLFLLLPLHPLVLGLL